MKNLLKLIPPTIRVTKKIDYEILWLDCFVNDAKQVGECRFIPKQIVIMKGLSATETFKTYIHETLHSLSYEYPGINLTENQTLALEDAIYKFLVLNKII